MCLSNVYLKQKQKNNLFMEDASRIMVDNGTIYMDSLMGEKKNLQSYFISEVNFTENYVILKPKEKGEIHKKKVKQNE